MGPSSSFFLHKTNCKSLWPNMKNLRFKNLLIDSLILALPAADGSLDLSATFSPAHHHISKPICLHSSNYLNYSFLKVKSLFVRIKSFLDDHLHVTLSQLFSTFLFYNIILKKRNVTNWRSSYFNNHFPRFFYFFT